MTFGRKGNGYGQFSYPWDVATNDNIEILVSDTGNKRIQLFCSNGVFLRMFEFPQNYIPRGVIFDQFARIIVTSNTNSTVYRVSPDFSDSHCFTANQQSDENITMRLQKVLVDDEGTIVMSDSYNQCIYMYNNFGQLYNSVNLKYCHEHDPPYEPYEIGAIGGISFHPKGQLIYVDQGLNHIIFLR